MQYPKLRSSVSVVKISDHMLEFVLTNTRKHFRIKVQDDTIFNIIRSLDGKRTVKQIEQDFGISSEGDEDFRTLLSYLQSLSIISFIGEQPQIDDYGRFRRVIISSKIMQLEKTPCSLCGTRFARLGWSS